jgi:hypothetical protein
MGSFSSGFRRYSMARKLAVLQKDLVVLGRESKIKTTFADDKTVEASSKAGEALWRDPITHAGESGITKLTLSLWNQRMVANNAIRSGDCGRMTGNSYLIR